MWWMVRAREAVPELEHTWWAVLHTGLAAGEHAQAREAMQRLCGEFGQDSAEMEANLDLEAFHASPEEAAWEAWKRGHR